jgi:outer membrane protein TolC
VFQLLTLAAAFAAAPQCGPLDLDTALALASANGDEVAIRRGEIAAAEADLSLANALRWFPSANATVLTGEVPEARGTVTNPIAGSNRSLAGIGPFVRLDVNVIQPLYTWGRIDAAQAAAKAGIEARTLLLQDTTSQVQLRVVQLFWGEALARRLLAIAADVEKALVEVDKRINDALADNSDEVKPSDRFQLDVYRAQLRRKKAEAQRGLALAHAGLAATLASSPERVVVQEAQLPIPPVDVPELGAARATAVQQRPDVAALDQAILARSAEVRAAGAAQLPQIFLGGTFAFSYAPNRDIQTNPFIGDYFNTLGGGIALGFRQDLAFPLLRAQAEKARAERSTLERQREGLMRLVEVQVETAVADVRSSAERFGAAKDALQAAKAWFRSVGLDFEAGVAEGKDLLTAYGAYVEAQIEQAQATYELVLARARLDQATGAAPRKLRASCELR